MDNSSAGKSSCAGSETRCPVSGLKLSGKSSGPYMTGDGIGCSVDGTDGLEVGEACVAITVAGDSGSPGCVAVELPLLQPAKSKTRRLRNFVLRDIYLFINSPYVLSC